MAAPTYLTHTYCEIPIHSLDIKDIQSSVDALAEGLIDAKLEIASCYHESNYYDGGCDHTEGGMRLVGWKPLPPDVAQKNLEREAAQKLKNKEIVLKRKATERRNAEKKFAKLLKERPDFVESLKNGSEISLPLSKMTHKLWMDAQEAQSIVKKYPDILEKHTTTTTSP